MPKIVQTQTQYSAGTEKVKTQPTIQMLFKIQSHTQSDTAHGAYWRNISQSNLREWDVFFVFECASSQFSLKYVCATEIFHMCSILKWASTQISTFPIKTKEKPKWLIVSKKLSIYFI